MPWTGTPRSVTQPVTSPGDGNPSGDPAARCSPAATPHPIARLETVLTGSADPVIDRGDRRQRDQRRHQPVQRTAQIRQGRRRHRDRHRELRHRIARVKPGQRAGHRPSRRRPQKVAKQQAHAPGDHRGHRGPPDRHQPRHQQPKDGQKHDDTDRTEPEDRGDQPADRLRRRIQRVHDTQLRGRVRLHHRDRHHHHHDGQPEPERIGGPPPGRAPAPRPKHHRTQPRRHPAPRARRLLARYARHGSLLPHAARTGLVSCPPMPDDQPEIGGQVIQQLAAVLQRASYIYQLSGGRAVPAYLSLRACRSGRQSPARRRTCGCNATHGCR